MSNGACGDRLPTALEGVLYACELTWGHKGMHQAGITRWSTRVDASVGYPVNHEACAMSYQRLQEDLADAAIRIRDLQGELAVYREQ